MTAMRTAAADTSRLIASVDGGPVKGIQPCRRLRRLVRKLRDSPGRRYCGPCVHEHACIRCPALRPDPDQEPRLTAIIANLHERITEARQHGWLGEIAGLETSLEAATHKLTTTRRLAERHQTTHLGMPDFRHAVGRSTRTETKP